MKKLLILLVTAMLACSCSTTNLFELFDMKRPDAEHILASAQEFTTTQLTGFVQTLPDGKIVETPLRPGSKIRILAGIARQPHNDGRLSDRKGCPGSYQPDTYYIVELVDGTRGIAPLPELAVGQQVRRKGLDSVLTVTGFAPKGKKSDENPYPFTFTCDNGQVYAYSRLKWEPMRMPMYAWRADDPKTDISECIKGARKSPYSTFYTADELDDAIVGKPFSEVERRFGPAMQVVRKGTVCTALYPHISRKDELGSSWLLAVELQDSSATRYAMLVADTTKYARVTRFISKLVETSMPGYINRHYIYWQFPRFEFFDLFRLGHNGRMIADFLLCFILSVGLIYILFIRMTRPLMRLRGLSNGEVRLLRILVYLLLTAGLVYLFGLYIGIMTPIVILMLFYEGCKDIRYELESERCPNCHAFGNLCYEGEADSKSSQSASEVRTEKHFTHSTKSSSSWTDSVGQKHVHEKITHHWVPVKKRTITTTRTWREAYYCPDCGKSISYRKEDTDSRDVSA